ncbi:hypothetical protein Tco_1180655 [Tanacetum coccineum]
MSVRELLLQEKLNKALQAVCEKLNQQEQAANVSTHTPEPSRRFKFFNNDDDVDEEKEKRERSLDNNSYVEEYDCSSLALD